MQSNQPEYSGESRRVNPVDFAVSSLVAIKTSEETANHTTHAQAAPAREGVCAPASRFDESTCRKFVDWYINTPDGEGITNPIGYARWIYQNGFDDVRIEQWLKNPDPAQPASSVQPVRSAPSSKYARSNAAITDYYGEKGSRQTAIVRTTQVGAHLAGDWRASWADTLNSMIQEAASPDAARALADFKNRLPDMEKHEAEAEYNSLSQIIEGKQAAHSNVVSGNFAEKGGTL